MWTELIKIEQLKTLKEGDRLKFENFGYDPIFFIVEQVGTHTVSIHNELHSDIPLLTPIELLLGLELEMEDG
ncbi:MAG: hypothetical protein R8G66_23950 [Cytophagales bacterium]|nr:hypothetical protein [Cytophagales bacterium]